jgi:hypothetical protein
VNDAAPKQDYKHTISLPETDFRCAATCRSASRHPRRLAARRAVRADRAHAQGRPSFVLHDGPPYANGAIHIGHAVNKILKDVVVKSRLVAGYDAPYVPGWDCHGLPIELAVEKKFGKVGDKLDAAAFRAKCREYAQEQIEGQSRDFQRLGVLGEWQRPYKTMDFAFEADMLRALAKIVERGHLARGVKPVHWCFDCGSALAEAEIEYQDKVSPAVDVAYDALDPKGLAAKFGVDAGDAIVAIPIWTTTPWTLPASLAVTLGPELEYVLVEGPAREGRRQLLVLAEALWEDCARRYGVEGASVLGRVRGDALEGLQLQHPFYARVVPVILGEHVTIEAGTGAVHTAPGPRPGGLRGRAEVRPGGAQPVDGKGVFLPSTEIFAGQYIWKANDAIVALLGEKGVLLAARSSRTATRTAGGTRRRWPSAPRRSGSSPWSRPTCAATRSRRSRTCAGSPTGAKRASPDGRRTPGLVHQPPAHLGRADRAVRASRERRAASAQRGADARGRRSRAASGADAWYALEPRNCSAPRRRSTTRPPTSSTCGSIPASPTRACSRHGRRMDCASPPTSISKAPTSIVAGSRARCSPAWRWTASPPSRRCSPTASPWTSRARRCRSRSATWSSRRR